MIVGAMIVGAIDVGSNAIRVAIGEYAQQKLKVVKCLREPLRLGSDSFSLGKISEPTMESLEKLFEKLKRLFIHYGVVQYRAVATSALREASNSQQVIKRIQKRTELILELIDPNEEALLVYLAVRQAMGNNLKNALIVDIGGGSVEVIGVQNQAILEIHSLALGTVKLLKKFGDVSSAREKCLTCISKELSKTQDLATKLGLGRNQVKSTRAHFKFVGTGGNVEVLANIAKNESQLDVV